MGFIDSARRDILFIILIGFIAILLTGCARAGTLKPIEHIFTPTITVVQHPLVIASSTAGGPTLIPQPPTVLNETCMIGLWVVDELQRAIADSFSQIESTLQLSSVEGQTFYQFNEDGQMVITFQELNTTLKGTIEGKDIQARNLMNGTATALYRINPDQREITFSKFGGDGIQFQLEINSQVLAQGDFPAWRAFTNNLVSNSTNLPAAGPTRVVEEARASATCAEDHMTLQAIDPVPGPQVKLKKINP